MAAEFPRACRAILILVASSAISPAPAETVPVPLDHDAPGGGSLELPYERPAELVSGRPTVIVVHDARSRWIERTEEGLPAAELFGEGFNVVVATGRALAPAAISAVSAVGGSPDWETAYRLFRTRQWVEDLDALRRKLVGPDGRVSLYGRGGGALLLHQYLAEHGEHVLRAFAEGGGDPWLDRRLGVNPDRFWLEVEQQGPKYRTKMTRLLGGATLESFEASLILERQRYFVAAPKLADARLRLAEAAISGDRKRLGEYRRFYELEEATQFLDSTESAAFRVRVFELLRAAGEGGARDGEELAPSRRVAREVARPLAEAAREGNAADEFDHAPLRDVPAEIFVLAGRHDPTADYRSQIALATHYRDATLFIADEGFGFPDLRAAGLHAELVRAFLAGGAVAAETAAVLRRCEPHRWVE